MMLLNTPAPSLPIGSILAYAGVLGDIPTGWAICDGTNGTPDLTDSFVMGGTLAQKGQTGGANSVTPSGSVNVSASVHNHTLSTSQIPSHKHISPYGYRYTGPWGQTNSVTTMGADSHAWGGSDYTSPVGSNGAHNHGVTASGSLNANAQDNKPKYYKTAYIMRVS